MGETQRHIAGAAPAEGKLNKDVIVGKKGETSAFGGTGNLFHSYSLQRQHAGSFWGMSKNN